MSQESSDNTGYADFFFDIHKGKIVEHRQPIRILEVNRIKDAVPELPPPADALSDPEQAASYLASALPFHIALIHAIVRREALNPLPKPGTIRLAITNLPHCRNSRRTPGVHGQIRNLPTTLGGSLLNFLNDVKAALQLSRRMASSQNDTYVEVYSTVIPELLQSADNLLAVLDNTLEDVSFEESAVEQPEVVEEGDKASAAVELAVNQPEDVEVGEGGGRGSRARSEAAEGEGGAQLLTS